MTQRWQDYSSLIIKKRDDADELRKLEGDDVVQEEDALRWVEYRLADLNGLPDEWADDNGYAEDTRIDDENEEPDTTAYEDGGEVGIAPMDCCVDISVDEVLGPGAQVAYDLRRELEDAGLMKTRRPGERCE